MIENEKKKNSHFQTHIFENRLPFSISHFFKTNSDFRIQTPIFWKQTPIFNKTNTDFSSQTQMSL